MPFEQMRIVEAEDPSPDAAGVRQEEEARVNGVPWKADSTIVDPTVVIAKKNAVAVDLIQSWIDEDARLPVLTVATPTITDVDNLWDWIRRDRRDGFDFSIPYAEATTSVALHALVQTMIQKAADTGRCAIYAIHWRGTHVGFVSLDILVPLALVHLYLCPKSRGSGLAIGRALLAEAATRHPDVTLTIVTPDPRIQKFAKRVGFGHTRYMLTQTDQELS